MVDGTLVLPLTVLTIVTTCAERTRFILCNREPFHRTIHFSSLASLGASSVFGSSETCSPADGAGGVGSASASPEK